MRASESIRLLAKRWPHLYDLPFEDVPDTRVGMLIDWDVPEAHWVLDQRIGGRRDSYAVRTIFGWILHLPEKMATGLYDPLGFVAPWLLPGNILLKNLC
ncbi:unnamed protein product [Echinostoma caproni]|uniref:Aminoglycoside phosphotransferase n=1 Tax=Echinostoma caproni TaxID=27848 RepID=A0A183BDE3_9TREM|nr:unnamed protein product [Echinostoma caproni]